MYFLMANNLRFLSNNVNLLRPSQKRVNMFEYFKCQIVNNDILLPIYTHASEDTFKGRREDFNPFHATGLF